MLFSEIISNLTIYKSGGNLDIPIKGIAYDSRKISAGFVFVAIHGFKADGHKYIKQALDNGACALIIEKPMLNSDVAWVQVDNTRMALAEASAAFYGYPHRNMEIIGITGTNGKTTTAFLMYNILQYLGHKTGLIGTIHNIIGKKIVDAVNTTPESLDLQKMLHEMLKNETHHVVMEVSSHALSLYRVHGLSFKTAIFTNLSQDHLDFHADMDEYAAAKSKLFKKATVCIINNDDARSSQMISASSGEVITYGVNKRSDVMAENIRINPEGMSFEIFGKYGRYKINVHLTGEFNVYNILAAFSAAVVQGYEARQIIAALENINTVPGRFEIIKKGQPFTVIIDYAHTPDGLENILITAKNIANNRLITVFGCGGDRDATKRPLMGEIAANYSDYVVITSDNPRTEDPNKIIEDIIKGVFRVKRHGARVMYNIIENREKAIFHAIKQAQEGDVVVIAGKGHETYQSIGSTRYNFDDKEVAAKALEEWGYEKF